MKPLSPTDQLFLLLEKPHQAMHVGGLQLLTPPPDAGPDFVQVVAERLRQAVAAEPPFQQRLVKRFGLWHWDEDRQFDVEHHFRVRALPSPGRIRELLALVSQLHAAHLDRARPLWEFYLIEGVEGGRIAIYAKMHHAMVDGVAAMRMTHRSLSPDPEDREMPAIWAMPRRRRTAREAAAPEGLTGLLGALGAQLGSVPKVTLELGRLLRDSRRNPDAITAYQAPRCILNQPITGARRFAAQSWDLARIRAVGKALGATVNDVVLAMCASALRRYLAELDALPDAPLISMIPMSLRQDDSDGGNQVGVILASLATDREDPAARLAAIQASVREAKARYARMNPTEILNYTATLLAPAGLNLMTGVAPRWQSFNVVISNVPGPREPLYWNGARLEGLYPVSIVCDGQALNITLTSVGDHLEFGLIACRRTLPHMQRLLTYLEDGLADLEMLVQ